MKILQNIIFSVFSYHVVLASVPNERFDKQDQTVENGTLVKFEGLRPDTEYKVRIFLKKKIQKILRKFQVTIEGIGQTAPNTDESFSHLRTKRANPYNPYSRRTSSSNRSQPKRTQQLTSSSREPQAAYSPRQYTRQQPPANIDTSKFDPEATIITECKRIDQTDLGRFSNPLSDRPVQGNL